MPSTRRFVIEVALLAALVSGCYGPRSAPAPVGAVPACPGPALDVESWDVVSDSAGVTYRLPDGFVEQVDPRLPHRQWSYEGRSSGYVWIGFNSGGEHWITLRRAPSPGMHEMTECIDSVPGRQVLVQAWRTEGGIFRGGRRSDRYDVLALVPIAPDLTVVLTGGGSDRGFQTLLLAMVRTVRVPPP